MTREALGEIEVMAQHTEQGVKFYLLRVKAIKRGVAKRKAKNWVRWKNPFADSQPDVIQILAPESGKVIESEVSEESHINDEQISNVPEPDGIHMRNVFDVQVALKE